MLSQNQVYITPFRYFIADKVNDKTIFFSVRTLFTFDKLIYGRSIESVQITPETSLRPQLFVNLNVQCSKDVAY